MRTLPGLLLATLLLAGCGAVGATPVASSPSSPQVTESAPSSATAARPARPSRPTLAEIVADPRATLSAVRVTPGPDGDTVSAWWLLMWHRRLLQAIVTSDDGMRTASYAAGTYRAWSKGWPPVTEPTPVPGLGDDLMPSDVFSLRDGLRAQQGGGDGATLDPFQRVMRSVDGGPWVGFDVPQTDGQQGYTSGQVVLPDGRLLVLLGDWSGDRRGRPNPPHHGLWISDGDDWSSYRPWQPTFTPALPAAIEPRGPLDALGAALDPQQTVGGIVWVTTMDRLYVSTDGARTFREIPARP